MSDCKDMPKNERPQDLPHAHPDGRRCCGRPISEKCTPDEEAAKTNSTGEKSCCKGHQKH